MFHPPHLVSILSLLYMLPLCLAGQVEHLEEQIEKSAEILEINHDYSDVIEDMKYIAVKPLAINNANAADLETIPYLTPSQRKDLFDYVSTYGEVLSIYELQSIKGFDSLLIRKIEPFILITPPHRTPAPTPKNLLRFGHHELVMRFEQIFPKSAGYKVGDSVKILNPGSYYLGSPQRYYLRYTYMWFDKIKIGIAGEKDPGEQLFRGAQSAGMDFYTGFISLSNIGILRNLIIGNFRASYGLGLTFGSGLSLAPTPGFTTTTPMATGIRTSLGMNEGSYMRGLGATVKIKKVEISGFASYHPRDATVISFDTISQTTDEISSFITSGYHRTQAELAKKNALTELIIGGNINFNKALSQQSGFKIGLTGIYNKYSAMAKPSIQPYNQFEFQGDQNIIAGVDYQLRYKRLHLFGEISRSQSQGMAWLQCGTITPDPRLCITLIYRDYQKSYQNMFANAFGQSSLNANENGIYTAISAMVHPRLSLSGYLDLFKFPWLKYRTDTPTNGQEFGATVTWQSSGDMCVEIRFYQKNVRSNESSLPGQIMRKLVDNMTRSYRCNFDWLTSSQVVLKTRIEVKETREAECLPQFGYLLYQEVHIKSSGWLKNLTLRFSLFDIPDYNSRIYVYEPEVLFGYSVPAYQGKGIRTCAVIKFGFAKNLDIWLRGGITYYTDLNEIGTGLDQITGNVKSEITGQLLFRL